MSESFSPDARKLIVPARVVDTRNGHGCRLTIDTGSGITVVSAALLRRLGVDLSQPVGYTRLRGVTGVRPARHGYAYRPCPRSAMSARISSSRPTTYRWGPTPTACLDSISSAALS
jgi:hypothetical protein